MANNETLKNQLAPAAAEKKVRNISPLQSMLDMNTTKQKFEEVLKGKSTQFTTSILSLYNNDSYLQKCDPKTILSSAMIAATLDLPIEKNLGYAYLVPYKSTCNFILGYKGYIQLALRSGQYKSINVVNVYEGELIKWNPLSEEIEIDFECRKSDVVIGYAGYFELHNGFKKTIYMSKEEIEKHRKQFSKSDFGWKNNYDAMGRKTVIRKLIGGWGIMSVEMQKAYVEDNQDQFNNEIENQEVETTTEENFVEAEYVTE